MSGSERALHFPKISDLVGMLLGVNIDHIATLRQARHAQDLASPNAEPCVIEAAHNAIKGGADSITLHVRADRRHMQEEDVYRLQDAIDVPINLEMGNTPELLAIALKLKPTFVCMVPETREEITTEGGLDVVRHYDELVPTIDALRAAGIKLSMFIDAELEQVEASKRLGAEMIELHTGCFANAFGDERKQEVERLVQAAERGHAIGLQVNAGHGINYTNIEDLLVVPHLTELNIGHTIVARSTVVGLEAAVREMRALMP